jgi:hypothetical protein
MVHRRVSLDVHDSIENAYRGERAPSQCWFAADTNTEWITEYQQFVALALITRICHCHRWEGGIGMK